MQNKIERYIPLIVTVGQVVIFPYYIVWLKEVSFSYTLFAWLFATFSFAAAWGYRFFQSRGEKPRSFITSVYVAMGVVYIVVGYWKLLIEYLPYVALMTQIVLGFLQGYFRAWHTKQRSYHVHAINHYLIVGVIMIALSFMKVVSPSIFLTVFGIILCMCGIWEVVRRKKFRNSC
ncbi:hypothetical protein D1953_19705 [Peribacillus asahii]|uniref:Uncharacterized protein n=1 Tax=Peribacillus asahii TaxID=228899 RepID=A0A398AVR9_9BACI|nr:hypothetical protein [Peribacillus asahii]RID81819.1 hypothetical protein D1953_19705 [Peribacillus asahii]